MKLHEHQAKEFFRAYGIPVQKGTVVERPEQVDEVAAAYPVVVKAQVLVGGRGKAGGIRFAQTPREARDAARAILGMEIKGEVVRKVLIVEAADIEREYYLAFTIDRGERRLALVASAAGGVDIEEVAATAPERILKVPVDPLFGFHPFQARSVGRRLGFGGGHLVQFTQIAHALYRLCTEKDAELAEINPLAVAYGDLLAVDAKLIIEDNALYRHTDLPRNEEMSELERMAHENELSYVELDGDIAVIGNGAGLVMATLDMIAHFGGRPANFLDIGGGASTENMEQAIDIVLRKRGIRSLLINIFGGITRCDDIARGIVASPPAVPASIRLVGTNEMEGQRILREAGISAFVDPEQAAREAVRLAS